MRGEILFVRSTGERERERERERDRVQKILEDSILNFNAAMQCKTVTAEDEQSPVSPHPAAKTMPSFEFRCNLVRTNCRLGSYFLGSCTT